jgi:hypothetical protein
MKHLFIISLCSFFALNSMAVNNRKPKHIVLRNGRVRELELTRYQKHDSARREIGRSKRIAEMGPYRNRDGFLNLKRNYRRIEQSYQGNVCALNTMKKEKRRVSKYTFQYCLDMLDKYMKLAKEAKEKNWKSQWADFITIARQWEEELCLLERQ